MTRLDTKSIDGLRGLASLHVAIGHMFIYSQPPTIGTDFVGGASMGLFFMISGFVMTLGYGQIQYSDSGGMFCEKCCCIWCDSFYCCLPNYTHTNASILQQEQDAIINDNRISFNFYDFLMKRLTRLAPLYYLTNLLALPFLYLYKINVIIIILLSVLSFFWVTSWVRVLGIEPLNGVLWSVSTMLFFYLCFPCIIVRIQQIRSIEEFRLLACKMYCLQIFLFLFILLLRFDIWLSYFTWRTFPPNRLPVFIMGCCLGFMRTRVSQDTTANHIDEYTNTIRLEYVNTVLFNRDDPTTPILIILLTIGLAILLRIGYYFLLTFCLRIFSEIFYPIIYFDWILVLSNPKRNENNNYSAVEKFLRSSAMQFMGKISMSFYMIHFIVLRYTAFTIHYIQTNDIFFTDKWVDNIPSWAIPLVLGISILLGWFLTVFFEVPVQNKLLAILKRQESSISTSPITAPAMNMGEYTPVSCVEISPIHTEDPLSKS